MPEAKNEIENSETLFRFFDGLPAVCVVCGQPATGSVPLQVDLPMDSQAKAMGLVQRSQSKKRTSNGGRGKRRKRHSRESIVRR